MKTALLLSLMTVSFLSVAEARPLFGRVEKYIDTRTNTLLDIGTNEVADDGKSAFTFDRSANQRKNIDMSVLSKSTSEEIAGVKAGESILAKTLAANSNVVVSRTCVVFHLFENKSAYVGCAIVDEDSVQVKSHLLPDRFNYVITNVENVIAEVASLDGISKNETVELRVDTKNIKAGRSVIVLAVFANGEALIQKVGFGMFDTGSVITKRGVERVSLQDLNKLK